MYRLVAVEDACVLTQCVVFFCLFFLLSCVFVCMIPINIQQMASLSGMGPLSESVRRQHPTAPLFNLGFKRAP